MPVRAFQKGTLIQKGALRRSNIEPWVQPTDTTPLLAHLRSWWEIVLCKLSTKAQRELLEEPGPPLTLICQTRYCNSLLGPLLSPQACPSLPARPSAFDEKQRLEIIINAEVDGNKLFCFLFA